MRAYSRPAVACRTSSAIVRALDFDKPALTPVSYTHLDVYKRQGEWGSIGRGSPTAGLAAATAPNTTIPVKKNVAKVMIAFLSISFATPPCRTAGRPMVQAPRRKTDRI